MNLLVSATPKSILKSMCRKRFHRPAVGTIAPRLQPRRFVQFVGMLLLVAGSSPAVLCQASAATPELTAPELWQPQHVPFSFHYGGKPSAQLLAGWRISRTIVADRRGEIHRTTYTDLATHLTVMVGSPMPLSGSAERLINANMVA